MKANKILGWGLVVMGILLILRHFFVVPHIIEFLLLLVAVSLECIGLYKLQKEQNR